MWDIMVVYMDEKGYRASKIIESVKSPAKAKLIVDTARVMAVSTGKKGGGKFGKESI